MAIRSQTKSSLLSCYWFGERRLIPSEIDQIRVTIQRKPSQIFVQTFSPTLYRPFTMESYQEFLLFPFNLYAQFANSLSLDSGFINNALYNKSTVEIYREDYMQIEGYTDIISLHYCMDIMLVVISILAPSRCSFSLSSPQPSQVLE